MESFKKSTELVCEASFLFMLGYISTMSASDANSLWQEQRRTYMEIKKPTSSGINISSNSSSSKGSAIGGMKIQAKSPKRMNAEAFLRYLRQLYFGDEFVTKEGVDKVSTMIIIIMVIIIIIIIITTTIKCECSAGKYIERY